ncbi:hypothetical protein JTE90_003941 [Oedothorax gibbosus]|uniref:Uncharacterized protein n=1 Tax=Oedothorax gibbosus TaxID=931172 RepID=A0AAV6UW22_9ARAC|nr:hypothetical protein JTE90_003941 [Oedothorax gibbosus]
MKRLQGKHPPSLLSTLKGGGESRGTASRRDLQTQTLDDKAVNQKRFEPMGFILKERRVLVGASGSFEVWAESLGDVADERLVSPAVEQSDFTSGARWCMSLCLPTRCFEVLACQL